MKCPKCNAKLSEGAKFCVYCGEKIEAKSIQQESVENNSPKSSEKQDKLVAQNRVLLVTVICLVIVVVAIVGWSLWNGKGTSGFGTQTAQSSKDQSTTTNKSKDESTISTPDITETVAPTPTPLSFEDKIIEINKAENALEQIDIYEKNYEVRDAEKGDYWDKTLFYKLEDIDKKSDKDGLLNTYNIEAKTLQNKESGNKIEYILYRNPNNNSVNKIVSMEYLENGKIETVDYYFTDEGKVDFIFFHTVLEYTPSYATRNKPGERYYFDNDAMTKWRVTTKENDGSIKELNYIATKAEWGDQKKCPWWSMLKDTPKKIQKQFQENAVRWLNAAYNTYHAVVDTESINLVSGCVVDEYNEILKGATIRLFTENEEKCLFECSTDEDGRYELYIPSDDYTYRLEIEKEGFLAETVYGIKPAREIVELDQENVRLFQEGEAGNMYFYLRHAFKEESISEARITIRKGINNRFGEIYNRFDYMEDEDTGISLEPGNYTLEIESADYQTIYKNIWFIMDDTIQISLSPMLEDGEVRIVLDWGEYPEDLDAHLFTPYDEATSEDSYHIWYDNQTDPYGNNLDRDDTDSFGPETMTIRNLKNGCYKYYVADFTNCSDNNPTSHDMSESGAQVNVYTSEGEVQTFYVPPNRSGVIWEVFEIRNGRLNLINHYYKQIEDKPWWHQEK